MSTRIAAQKETEIAEYVNGLFSGGISNVVDNGDDTYDLTITFTNSNFYHTTSLPTLRAGDRITIYDSLSSSGQVFIQPRITSIVSANVVRVESSTAILDSYSWRLLSCHTQAENPTAFYDFEGLQGDKSSLPICVVVILNSESFEGDKFNTCADSFLCRLDLLESVENRFTDTQQLANVQWTSAACQDAKYALDYWLLIIQKNMKIQQIDSRGSNPRYRVGTIGGHKEVHGVSKFFKINWNNLNNFK